MIQRATGFSLSDYAQEIFHAEFLVGVIPITKNIVGVSICICVLTKIAYLIRDRFGKVQFDTSDTEKFMEVISLFQSTTTDLINRVVDAKCCCKSGISNRNRFSTFAQGIALSLTEYVATGFKAGNIRKKDLFISLYEHVDSDHGPALKRLFHIAAAKYHIYSHEILIDGDTHKNYECVHAIKEGRSLVTVADARKLRVNGRKRHKSMTHYIGAPVKVSGQLVGFLNLEFHEKKCFSNEEELEDFAQNFFLPFQMLIEQAFAKWQLARSVEIKCGCN